MKLIYCHIPKTGGTSLRLTVEANYESDELCAIYDVEDGRNDIRW